MRILSVILFLCFVSGCATEQQNTQFWANFFAWNEKRIMEDARGRHRIQGPITIQRIGGSKNSTYWQEQRARQQYNEQIYGQNSPMQKYIRDNQKNAAFGPTTRYKSPLDNIVELSKPSSVFP